MKDVMFKGETSMFKNISIIWDDGEFAVAEGTWDEETETRIGMRYYGEGIGCPQAFGKPQWLVLPHAIGDMLRLVLSIKRVFSRS